ncbi:MAG: hypothetical protein ABIG46_00675 [Candidatus Omnitrophota bacterium]|nr:hypothetical protein [Candidatus Omnitrophota bacterium]
MFIRLNKKGQSTAEFAILIGLVIGAVVAMQVYIKRGLQGKMKDAVDYSDTDTAAVFSTGQYEPYYASSQSSTAQSASETTNTQTGGAVDKTETSDVSATRQSTTGW